MDGWTVEGMVGRREVDGWTYWAKVRAFLVFGALTHPSSRTSSEPREKEHVYQRSRWKRTPEHLFQPFDVDVPSSTTPETGRRLGG